MVHRDVKPGNILLDLTVNVYITKIARASLLVPLLVGCSLAGCGTGADTGSAAAGSPPPGPVHVVMKSLDFSPTAVHAKVGQTVVWTNDDEAPHNVTYVSGPRFKTSRLRLTLGMKFSITLTEPGTIDYFCSLHPWMTATVVVSR